MKIQKKIPKIKLHHTTCHFSSEDLDGWSIHMDYLYVCIYKKIVYEDEHKSRMRVQTAAGRSIRMDNELILSIV